MRAKQPLFLSVFLLFLLFSSALVYADAANIYIVRPGDTLWGIAQKFGLSPYTLARANGISPRAYVYINQRLVIPTGANTSQSGRYVVKPGDTLSGIAWRYGVSLGALAQANGLTTRSFVYVGQRLRIPGRGTTSAPSSTPTQAGAARVYVVRRGDTLSAIASRFGVSLDALARANGIRNPSLIYIGQRLVIPAHSPSNATSPPTSGGGGLRFVVDVSMQRCWLYRGNVVLYRWACSTGRRGYPTRYGTFYVQNKLPVAYGSVWNINMPYWLGIYWAGSLQNGIHGLPWNATTGAKVWAGLVGTPITFGCIMLTDTAARTLYEMAYVGMPIIIQP